MSGFRLLAVRPFLNCSERFCKNLQKGEIYKFYQDYNFLDENKNIIEGDNIFKMDDDGQHVDNDVFEIVKNSEITEEIYNITDSNGRIINVSVSALVGKNGSGKSSIIELVYVLCYIIALKKGIITDHSELSKLINNKNVDHNKLFQKIDEIQDVFNDFRAEIYYEIEGKFYSIWYNQDQVISHRSLNKDLKNNIFNPDDFYQPGDNVPRKFSYILDSLFFYTISINYSLYGLNSSFDNSWLKDLFHKNDGYQTPLVINPFRKNGNIDVNSELHLAQSRLLSNLVDDTFVIKDIVNGKTVEAVLFTLDYTEFKSFRVLDLDNLIKRIKKQFDLEDSEFITKVYNAVYTTKKTRINKIDLEDVKHSDLLVKYVYRKILKIYSSYDEYKSGVELTKDKYQVPNFNQIFRQLIELRNDRSHITLKLRQVLNAIRFNTLKNTAEYIWTEEPDKYQKDPKKIKKHFFRLDIKEFIARIKDIKTSNDKLDLIELIPNACFRPTMYMKNGDEENTVTNFHALSSGEQHYIHSIQSILYHISNINSVFHTENEKIRYNYVNLIFDEIELYYHPEFQRQFLSDLLIGLENLSLTNIKGINILFSSHSPFILSDIPRNSVLKLKSGLIDKTKSKTFGANIHDILADSFFLENSFMGVFAEGKIQEVILWLNFQIAKLQGLEETFFSGRTKKDYEQIADLDKEYVKMLIDIVDEPLLKFKMDELYYTLYPNELDQQKAKSQIEILAKKSGLNIKFN